MRQRAAVSCSPRRQSCCLASLVRPSALDRWPWRADRRRRRRASAGVTGRRAGPAALARFGFALEEVGAPRRASTSCTRARPSTRSSTTSCRRSRRWAPRSPSPTSTATAGRTSTSPTAAKAASIASTATRATARSRTWRRELGVADVNRAGTGVSMGAVWGDYDNDGFEDLFLYKYGRPELFHNDAGRALRRVSASAPACRAGSTPTAAIWLDYDRDGRLDLFLAGYWPEDVDLWHLKTTRIMPESFEYAENGGRKYLFRNRGDGTFEDVTGGARDHSRAAGRSPRRPRTCSARAIRICSSPTTTASPQLYANQGGKRFVEVGARDRRRPHAEERHERVVRRRLQRRPPVDLQDQHLRAGRARAGQRSLGAEGARRRRRARVREPRVERWASTSAAGAGARSSATSTTTARSTCTSSTATSRRASARSYWYDFARDRRRAQRDHRRRAELAGDARAAASRATSASASGSTTALGRFTDVAQVVGVTDTLRRPRGRAGRSLEPRRARRHRRQPARAAPALHEHRAARAATGSTFELEGTREQPQRDRRARRAAVERPAAGAGGQRRQRLQRAEPAAAALRPRRGRRRSIASSIRWPSGRRRRSSARRSTAAPRQEPR